MPGMGMPPPGAMGGPMGMAMGGMPGMGGMPPGAMGMAMGGRGGMPGGGPMVGGGGAPVHPFLQAQQRAMNVPPPKVTLYVEGVPTDATEREVYHLFRPFPGLMSLRLRPGPNPFPPLFL